MPPFVFLSLFCYNSPEKLQTDDKVFSMQSQIADSLQKPVDFSCGIRYTVIKEKRTGCGGQELRMDRVSLSGNVLFMIRHFAIKHPSFCARSSLARTAGLFLSVLFEEQLDFCSVGQNRTLDHLVGAAASAVERTVEFLGPCAQRNRAAADDIPVAVSIIAGEHGTDAAAELDSGIGKVPQTVVVQQIVKENQIAFCGREGSNPQIQQRVL